jgi:hypothetical protein
MTDIRSGCRPPVLLLLLAMGLACTGTDLQAQYKWRDANGSIVYSDQPPPATVKPTQVLRATPLPSPQAEQGAKPADAAKSAALDKAPAATSERDADPARKNRDRQDAERKQREAADQAARLAKACEEARAELRNLESGMRMARVNAAGEREFLSDEDRSARTAQVRKDMQESCKAG